MCNLERCLHLSHEEGKSCGLQAYQIQKILRNSCAFRPHPDVKVGTTLSHLPDFPTYRRVLNYCGPFSTMIVLKVTADVASLAFLADVCHAVITWW